MRRVMVRRFSRVGQKFAVVDVEDFGGDAEAAIDLLHFLPAAQGERSSRHLPVADIAIGGGDEFDVMSRLSPHHGDSRAAVFGVVGVCSEYDNAQFAVVRRARGRRRLRLCHGHSGPRQGNELPEHEPQTAGREQCESRELHRRSSCQQQSTPMCCACRDRSQMPA